MSFLIHPCVNNANAEYLILSSGLGGHGHFWTPQLHDFKHHFHVVTYDQEGCHRHAEHLSSNYSLTDMAEQVLRILDEANITRFHFIGHALGGHIGAELARLLHSTPRQMLSLTSINAWDQLDPHTQKCFEARKALLLHAGIDAYVRAQALFLYPPAWISTHTDEIRKAEDHQLQDFPPPQNVLARLNALQQFKIAQTHADALKHTRMHLIANRDDFLVPVHKMHDLSQHFPHAQLSLFDQGAHASTVTETAKINAAMIAFLIHQ